MGPRPYGRRSGKRRHQPGPPTGRQNIIFRGQVSFRSFAKRQSSRRIKHQKFRRRRNPMKKRLLLLVLLPVLSAVAHHGYGEYDRDKQVAMEGTITHVLWGNPHVVITLQTEDRGEYSVE